MIHDLHRQGVSIQEISRSTGRDRKIVRKYLNLGLEPPVYGPRAARGSVLGPWKDFIRQRLQATSGLSAARFFREIRELGYPGGETTAKDFVRQVRPKSSPVFERRFETAPGAQVDFAHFGVAFTDDPSAERFVWLFSMVLGHSRWLFARFVPGQGLAEVVLCHIAAFEAIGGVTGEILYDRIKTVVIGLDGGGCPVFNDTLLDIARHYGITPRACRPYRAKGKGKVERTFRYIRQDFFLGREFRNLDDLNDQLGHWLEMVANPRVHGTTHRVVVEHFAEEKPTLKPLPEWPFRRLLALERRITKDGMISLDGNLYSVPDGTRRRVVKVHVMAGEIRILEDGVAIASHQPLPGRGGRVVATGHRAGSPPGTTGARGIKVADPVRERPLDVYDQVADALAGAAS